MTQRVRSTLRALRDYLWDFVHNVETRFPAPVVDSHASPYEPASIGAVRRLLGMLNGDLANCTFVDVGAGKGRPMLIAASYPFKKVVGVESSPALASRAQQNIRQFRGWLRCRAIECVCADARTFEWPSGPLAIFLFNPFDEVVMREVADRLGQSILREQRPVTILCVGRWTRTGPLKRLPGVRPVLAGRGFVVLTANA